MPVILMRLALTETAVLSVAGIVLGIVGALSTRQLFAAQLFGVGASDALTLFVAGVVLGCVAPPGAIGDIR